MTVQPTKLDNLQCPMCGQNIAEKEYEMIQQKFDETIKKESDVAVNIRLKEKTREYQSRLEELEKSRQESIKKQVELHIKQNLTREVEGIEKNYKSKLAAKEEELDKLRIWHIKDIESLRTETEKETEHKYRQREKEYEIQLSRINQTNRELFDKASKLQTMVDSIPPELKGTAGEMILLEELTKEFPTDKFTPKIVGVQMADIVQTIVTEEGRKLAMPIVYDNKVQESISNKSIEKAKSYRKIHNTDFSIIVFSKVGIEKNKIKLIHNRDGILVIHQSIVLEIANLIRSSIIDLDRQNLTQKEKESKRNLLYAYITSTSNMKRIRSKLCKKEQLDQIQRKEIEYHNQVWAKRDKLITEWHALEDEDIKEIDRILGN